MVLRGYREIKLTDLGAEVFTSLRSTRYGVSSTRFCFSVHCATQSMPTTSGVLSFIALGPRVSSVVVVSREEKNKTNRYSFTVVWLPFLNTICVHLVPTVRVIYHEVVLAPRK